MLQKVLYITAVSPVHNGAGRGIGAIDNPILRQRDTNLPVIQGSSIKGVLRNQWHEGGQEEKTTILFGPEPKSDNAHAGALAIGDAQLLLFPIRSLRGAFVWATSPLALALYQKTLAYADIHLDALDSLMDELTCERVPAATSLLSNPDGEAALKVGNQVILEEYGYQPTTSEELKELACTLAEIVFPEEYLNP